MTLDESIQGMRLRVMQRAAGGGVTRRRVARRAISRDPVLSLARRLTTLWRGWRCIPRRAPARPAARCRSWPPPVERRLLAVAIAEATWGPRGRLRPAPCRMRLAPSTVQRLLRRHGLATRRQRLLVLEHHSARAGGPADRADSAERCGGCATAADAGTSRPSGPASSSVSDDLLHRQAQGRGQPVWQITACDAATSYGVARILPALTPAATARFLRDVLRPAVRRAGWPLQRVLTDRWQSNSRPAFAADLPASGSRTPGPDPACLDQWLRRTRSSRPFPSAQRWCSFRRTLLHQPCPARTAASAASWHFYNIERPHHGYRVRGRTPATLFHARYRRSLADLMRTTLGSRIVSTPTRVLDSLGEPGRHDVAVPGLQRRDDAADVRGQLRRARHPRSLPRLRRLLVRRDGEPRAGAGLRAGSLRPHPREAVEPAPAGGLAGLSPLPRPARADGQYAAQHPLHLLALPRRPRALHHLPRVPPREELRAAPEPRRDRGPQAECPERHLLRLRGARRSRQGDRLRVLPGAAVHARRQAGGDDGRSAQAGREQARGGAAGRSRRHALHEPPAGSGLGLARVQAHRGRGAVPALRPCVGHEPRRGGYLRPRHLPPGRK